jgi:hypothetical protein
VLSHLKAFGNFKSLASHPQPKLSETRHAVRCRWPGLPTAVPGAARGAVWRVLVRRRGDGGRQAAARDPARLCLACAWSPSATYRARHRLGSRSEDPPRDLRARSVGGMSAFTLWGVAVLGVNYVSKLVRTRAWYSTFHPVFQFHPTGETARRGPWGPPFTMRKEGQGRKRCY